jgi:hypothetical protein
MGVSSKAVSGNWYGDRKVSLMWWGFCVLACHYLLKRIACMSMKNVIKNNVLLSVSALAIVGVIVCNPLNARAAQKEYYNQIINGQYVYVPPARPLVVPVQPPQINYMTLAQYNEQFSSTTMGIATTATTTNTTSIAPTTTPSIAPAITLADLLKELEVLEEELQALTK